jgi:hypothetical protein
MAASCSREEIKGILLFISRGVIQLTSIRSAFRNPGMEIKGTYLSYLSNLDETFQVSGIDRDQVYFVSIVVFRKRNGAKSLSLTL